MEYNDFEVKAVIFVQDHFECNTQHSPYVVNVYYDIGLQWHFKVLCRLFMFHLKQNNQQRPFQNVYADNY
jgi:hypothetical protein